MRNINWASLPHILEENISDRHEGFIWTIVVEPFACLTSLLIYIVVI